MELAFSIARFAHIIAGFVSLITLWLPIITKKGGKRHKQSGWVFVISMAIVSISAFYMGMYRIGWDAGPDDDPIPFSSFLIFISILSATTVSYGVRVLRETSDRSVLDFILPILLFISSIGMIVYGSYIDFSLLQYFPFIGLFLSVSQLIYWCSIPKKRSHPVVEHIVGMLSTCIATITAFLVFGAPRLLNINSVHLLLWFLPTIVFTPMIITLSMYYRNIFSTKR